MIEPTSNIPPRRVLIVEDASLIAMGMSSDLHRWGHSVVGIAGNGADAASLFRRHEPDLLLIDIRLQDDEDGLELAGQLASERPCAIVIVSAHSEPELVARAAQVGAFGYLVKPATAEALRAQIEIAVRRFDEARQLRHDNQGLVQDLETRKLVERAKGLLMKRLNLDEAAAHRRLQLESQKRRISIGDCARRVIDSEKVHAK